MLKSDNLKIIGKIWSGDAKPDDYKVSPMFGELKDLPKLHLFIGTREIICRMRESMQTCWKQQARTSNTMNMTCRITFSRSILLKRALKREDRL